jgi:hypothetical protein
MLDHTIFEDEDVSTVDDKSSEEKKEPYTVDISPA